MECRLPVHRRYSMLAVCPQYCTTCSADGAMSVHTLPHDVHIGGLLPFSKGLRRPMPRVVRLPGRTADVCQVSACVPEGGSHSPKAAGPTAQVRASLRQQPVHRHLFEDCVCTSYRAWWGVGCRSTCATPCSQSVHSTAWHAPLVEASLLYTRYLSFKRSRDPTTKLAPPACTLPPLVDVRRSSQTSFCLPRTLTFPSCRTNTVTPMSSTSTKAMLWVCTKRTSTSRTSGLHCFLRRRPGKCSNEAATGKGARTKVSGNRQTFASPYESSLREKRRWRKKGVWREKRDEEKRKKKKKH